MKKLLTLFITLLTVIPAFAIRFENGNDVQLNTPVNEDIYVAAGTITATAAIHGDFYAAGGTMNLSDTISGDLVVAGGTITLRGVVLDDVRAAGGNLIISGYIVGDLLIAGGTVTIESGAVIAGDVIIAGGTVHLEGAVLGNLKSGAGELFFNGSVAKSGDLNGGKITLNGKIAGETVIAAQNLSVGSGASLGRVRYWTAQGEVNFGNALKDGPANFDPSLKTRIESPRPEYLGFVTFFGVLGYLIAMFILLALGQRLFGPFFSRITEDIQGTAIQSLGYGFLYFAVTPIAILLLFVTLVGIPIGLIALVFYLLFLALAHAITALAGAHWLNERQRYQWNFWKIVLAALGILVGIKIISMIPFVGWLLVFLAVCIVFGAIWKNSGAFQRKATQIPSN